ncbi:MAG: helix-turn-helix transcriptional regulator [Actinomycetota bacterium]|nr:helix-turn-helix transcriptional regulator [Actinomycetota bacterium]
MNGRNQVRRLGVLPTGTNPPDARGVSVDALLASASREVLVLGTSAARDPLGVLGRIDRRNLRRGVRHRILVPDSVRTAPVLGPRLTAMSLAGAEVRTVPDVPVDALVVDGTTVLLPADPSTAAARVAVFRLSSVVTMTVELFEWMWPQGVSLTASRFAEAAELHPRQHKLLELLIAGSTDEAAAVRLGVSVRTVRRMVADIMGKLGARSRFQAGAKAADRGWLMARAG